MDAVQFVVAAAVVLAVVGFVVWPLVAGDGRRASTDGGQAIDDERIEARIAEYRAALRRRTVCARCLYANVAEARYCAMCGGRLPVADREAA